MKHIRATFVDSMYKRFARNCQNCQVSIYSHDTILYCFSSSTLLTSLNTDLVAVSERLNMNKLTLNLVKTKLMLLSREKICKNLSLSVQVSESEINEVLQLQYVGVNIFTSNLNWWARVQEISKTSTRVLVCRKKSYIACHCTDNTP